MDPEAPFPPLPLDGKSLGEVASGVTLDDRGESGTLAAFWGVEGADEGMPLPSEG